MNTRVMFDIDDEYVMFDFVPKIDITAYELAIIVPILKTMNPDHNWYSEQLPSIQRHFKRTVT